MVNIEHVLFDGSIISDTEMNRRIRHINKYELPHHYYKEKLGTKDTLYKPISLQEYQQIKEQLKFVLKLVDIRDDEACYMAFHSVFIQIIFDRELTTKEICTLEIIMTIFTKPEDYEETFDYCVPESLTKAGIHHNSYNKYLKSFSFDKLQRHKIFDAHRPPPEYHPIPLTYKQWIKILTQLEMQVRMTDSIGVPVDLQEIFYIAFVQTDPAHAKFSMEDADKYFLTL